MNSKLLLLLTSFFFISACGVKSDPSPPRDTLLPSIEDQYFGDEKEAETDKDKKKEKPVK